MPQRTAVHQILDAIPDELLAEVEGYLKRIAADAFAARLAAAPIDDEPLTEADLAAMARARADEAAGRVYSMDEVDELMDQLAARLGVHADG